MGFSPRVYELHLYLQCEDGDWHWTWSETYASLAEATKWFTIYKNVGTSAKIIETKVVMEYTDGRLFT